MTGVLIIGNFLSQTGAPRGASEDLGDRLCALGYRVIRSSSVTAKLLRLCDMLRATWKHRNAYGVAVVDVYSGPAFLWAEAVCCLLRRLRKPYILRLHGGNLPQFAAQHPRRVGRFLQAADVVTAPSEFLKAALANLREDIIEIPNAIDAARYHFRVRTNPQPRLVWLRAFHRIYNAALAPAVLHALSAQFPDARLTMIGRDKGDGSLAAATAAAARLGVANRCAILPEVPKERVPDALQAGDVFLNTASIDNTPVTVIEALASGLCVVSTDVGGIRNLLTDAHDALLVPADDPGAMAAAVTRVLNSPRLAESLSQNARRTASRFDWSAVLPQWRRLIAQYARG